MENTQVWKFWRRQPSVVILGGHVTLVPIEHCTYRRTYWPPRIKSSLLTSKVTLCKYQTLAGLG